MAHTYNRQLFSYSRGVKTGGVYSRRRQWAQLTWHDEALQRFTSYLGSISLIRKKIHLKSDHVDVKGLIL